MEAPLVYPINKIVEAGIPAYVAFSWLATAFILFIVFIAGRSRKLVPSGTQNVLEVIIEFFLDLSENTIGHMGRYFFPLIATLGIYILVCNFFGLIPGFVAPTSNLNTTTSMAIPVFLATHYYGIKTHGFGYIKHFLGPMRTLAALPLMILMFFIEIIGHLARPITLAVRLFGNMVAKELILIILAVLSPWIVPVSILGLGVLVCTVQAFVFALLTAVYLAGAVEEAH